MKDKRILYVSSEVVPYLAENEVSLMSYDVPKMINDQEGQIRIFMPRYGNINERRHQLHEVIRLSGMNLVVNDVDMPLIIKVAKGELSHLNVYGDDYNTRDGSCVRDYVHVMDIASAHVKALDRMLAGKMESALEFYNLGSENGYTVLELLQTFEKVNSVKVNYQIVGRREGDVSQIYSDSTLAKNKLDWKIKYSLEDMLSSAWERDKKNVK